MWSAVQALEGFPGLCPPSIHSPRYALVCRGQGYSRGTSCSWPLCPATFPRKSCVPFPRETCICSKAVQERPVMPPTGRHRGCALAGPGSPLISAWARLCFGGIFQCYRRVWRSAGVYSSAVVDGPVLASPAASSTLPSGSRKVWPPLFSPGVAAARDQVFVAGS